jgi:hypothetical protein
MVAVAATTVGVLAIRLGDAPTPEPVDNGSKLGVESPVHPSQVVLGISGNPLTRAALACVQRVDDGGVTEPVVLVGPPGEGYRKINAQLGPEAHFALSDDGKWFVQIGPNRVVIRADIAHGLEGRLDPLPFTHEVSAIRLSPGGGTLAVLSSTGGSIIDLDTGQTTTLQPFRSFLGWTADAESVLVVDESGALRRDPLATYNTLRPEDRPSEYLGQLPGFDSPSGPRLSAGATQVAEVGALPGGFMGVHASSVDGASSWSVPFEDRSARVVGWQGAAPILWTVDGVDGTETLSTVSSTGDQQVLATVGERDWTCPVVAAAAW